MQIDANAVKWDSPDSPTSIDTNAVQWDEAPRPGSTSENFISSTGEKQDFSSLGQQTAAPAQEAAPQQKRGLVQELGRQVGLTARYGLEGAGQAAEVFTEPVAALMRGAGIPTAPTGQAASGLADAIGLPQPENQTERVVGDMSRFVAGAGGMAGAARGAAGAMQAGPLQRAVQSMAAAPGLQMTGAAGAGLGAGMARENGGGAGAQLAAGLAGGVAAGVGVNGLVQGARAGLNSANVLMPARANRAEQQIAQAMQRAGVDWEDVPNHIRQGLQADVRQALRTGKGLDGDALARLMEFRTVGATPTRGTLTLDPGQITREQNLARTGVNSTDPALHGLSQVQHSNNQALIDSLNRMGAGTADDAVTAGEKLMGTLQRGVDAERGGVNALYAQARDNQGRSFPLDGHSFTTTASRLLDDNLLGGALPQGVQTHLNRIAQGEVPFTVDYAEQLKTAIGKLQRSTHDGQTRMALGLVRQALDETPVMGLGSAGPAAGARAVGGNQVYAGGAEIGEQAVDAFSRARLANATMMKRIERIPGLKAVYEGSATPDDFIQRHIVSRTAKAADVGALAAELKRTDPAAMDVVRSSIAQHLKTAAMGAASDEMGKFSASGYNRAMLALGPRKMQAFFTKEEITQLKAVGKVAQYTTAQPAGSAVNNSNTGAMLAGHGLDFLDRLASKVPMVGDIVQGAVRGRQQAQALDVGPALVRQQARQETQRGQTPRMTFGALMAAMEDEQ